MHARHDGPPEWFGLAAFEELVNVVGLTTEAEIGAWLGISESTYNRVANGMTVPGGKFIRAVMDKVRDDPRVKDHPSAKYDLLFPTPVPAEVKA